MRSFDFVQTSERKCIRSDRGSGFGLTDGDIYGCGPRGTAASVPGIAAELPVSPLFWFVILSRVGVFNVHDTGV